MNFQCLKQLSCRFCLYRAAILNSKNECENTFDKYPAITFYDSVGTPKDISFANGNEFEEMIRLSIMFNDDDILTVIDKQYFGRKFSIESRGIYTVRLGVFHDMDKSALEENAICCAIPTRSDCEQQITAAFDIPEASARFLDTVILKAASPFFIKPVPGSLILERHGYPLGIPLKYGSVREDDMTVLVRTGLRENVPCQYRAYFDLLSIQIEVMFVN